MSKVEHHDKEDKFTIKMINILLFMSTKQKKKVQLEIAGYCNNGLSDKLLAPKTKFC